MGLWPCTCTSPHADVPYTVLTRGACFWCAPACSNRRTPSHWQHAFEKKSADIYQDAYPIRYTEMPIVDAGWVVSVGASALMNEESAMRAISLTRARAHTATTAASATSPLLFHQV